MARGSDQPIQARAHLRSRPPRSADVTGSFGSMLADSAAVGLGDLAPPSRLLYFSDPLRALAGASRWPLTKQLARRAPRADGRPVLVLPGLLAGDASTRPLRAFLRRTGSHVHGWRLGRNIGPTPRAVEGLRELVARLVQRHGQPISVVGWSLGGVFARAVALEEPEAIAQVITLGSPFAMTSTSQSRATRAYERHAHRHLPGYGALPPPEMTHGLKVPATSIWSRQDGIVSWRTSVLPKSAISENISVVSSHLGLGHHPAVLWAVADRLAQPAGAWQPFVPPPWLRGMYPQP